MTPRPDPQGAPRRFAWPWRSRRRVAAELDQELEFHITQVAGDLRAAGWTAAEARAEALRRFGDFDFTRTYCRAEDLRREREKRRMTFLDEVRQDLRYALRSLRSSPGFTAAALLTLALGIGANTAIFSVVRGVLLEPLPFREPDQLVRVWHASPANGITRSTVSEPDYLDWRAQNRTAEILGAYAWLDGLLGVDLTGTGEPERLTVSLVTDGFFQALGAPAHAGRPFTAEEHVPGRDRVAVISHGLWTRRFGADPALVGRAITLDGEPFEVVGVMPRGFTYPADRAIDAWLPVSVFGPDQIGRARGAHFLSVVARLKPGVTEDQLRADLSDIAARLAQEHPDNPGWDAVTTSPLRDSIVGDVRRPLVVLMVAVAMLLLIACANIASLLLARATGRRRELAVRAALGAGRGRISRQLLTESLTLALLGGGLGVAVGFAAVRMLAAAGASELPRAADIRVDAWVLAFTLLVSVAAGLIFGLAPTMRASAHLERSWREGGRGTAGGAGQRLRSALVVFEVALAVMLVVGAGLAIKSFTRLMAVDPGFRSENALVATLSVPPRYDGPEAAMNYYVSVLEAIRAVPGVEAAGSIRDLPMRGRGELVRPQIPGRTPPPGGWPAAQRHHVSTDYFRAMGTRLLAGRDFALSDRADAPPVIVVNEEFARRHWPGESAVGKALRFGSVDVPIVGVVANVRQGGFAEPVEPAYYLHALQQFRGRMSIVVRVRGEPLQYAEAVRRAIWSRDPHQTITDMTTLDSVIGRAVARPRLIASLLALFGTIGLALGALGIFGVLAYSVSQRRQEIGVRVALGASPRAVLGLVVGHGMALALAGVAAGVGGALLLTSSMQSLLYGIQPSDPSTFAQVVAILLGAALLASWLPARRALAIDPVTALRYD